MKFLINGEFIDDNDNENISQIKEDDEYCVRFEDNKNSDSSEEENNGKNKSPLNILDNSLINNVLKIKQIKDLLNLFINLMENLFLEIIIIMIR